jgi:hypothetical protein
MQNALKVLKARYSKKIGIPLDVSHTCLEIITLPSFGLMSLNLIFLQTIPKLWVMGGLPQ